MRISDWSSDVCSSDLPPHTGAGIGILQLGRHVHRSFETGYSNEHPFCPECPICPNLVECARLDTPRRREQRRSMSAAASRRYLVGTDRCDSFRVRTPPSFPELTFAPYQPADRPKPDRKSAG